MTPSEHQEVMETIQWGIGMTDQTSTEISEILESLAREQVSEMLQEEAMKAARKEFDEAYVRFQDLYENVNRTRKAIAALKTDMTWLDRRVHDEPNITTFEGVCRIIDPSCKLLQKGIDKFWVEWTKSYSGATSDCFTSQQAWAEAFRLLDRRVKLADVQEVA